MLFKRSTLLASVAALTLTSPVFAQDTEDQPIEAESRSADRMGLDTIVVTARRREEDLQSVPVAVTALTPESLAAKGIEQPYDLIGNVPGLTVVTGGANVNDPQYYIRGQGSTYNSAPSVVAYFADVPVPPNSTSGGQNVTFFDLESVQVLKGPQGTLFGRSTTGGAVLFNPNRPTYEFEGSVKLGMGNYDAREVTGVINIPFIEDVLALRVAGNFDYHEGYSSSITTGQDLDDRNRSTLRLGLLFEPMDWLSNYTIFQDSVIRENNGAQVLRFFDPNNPLMDTSPTGVGRFIVEQQLCPAIQGGQACVDDRIARLDAVRDGLATEYARIQNGGDIRKAATSDLLFLRSHVQTLINTTELEFGDFGPINDVALKNIASSTRNLRSTSVYEIQGSPEPTGVVYTDLNYIDGQAVDDGRGKSDWGDVYSEEVQLSGQVNGKHDWILGYFTESTNQTIYYNWASLFLTLDGAFSVPAGYPGVSSPLTDDYEQKQSGIFAQTTLDLADIGLDNFKLTLGYRQSNVKESIVTLPTLLLETGVTPDPRIGLVPGFDPTTASINQTEDTYNISLDWQATDNVLLYIGTRRGFKQGGLNTQSVPIVGISPDARGSFQPEIVEDVEIGAKTDWNIGGVVGRTNIAIFSSDFSDLQRQATYVNPQTQATFSQIDNIAAAKVEGFEMDTTVNLTQSLQADVAYSYTDARYESYPGTSVDIAGNPVRLIDSPFTGAPKHIFGMTVRYWLPVPSEYGEMRASANYAYQSEYNVNETELYNPADETLEGFGILNLRLDWNNVMGHDASMGFFVRNATDEEYITGAGGLLRDLGTVTAAYGAPRTYGAELTVPF